MEENNIQLQSPRQSSPHYGSGDPLVFECKPDFRPVSQEERFSTQCLNGVISYPVCQCKCLLPKTWGTGCRRQFW